MPFPVRHKLLTVIGTAFGGTEDWSFGLRIRPTGVADVPEVTQAQVDALAPAVSTFFAAPPSLISAAYRLTAIKLAPVGVDGKYPPGEVAVEHVYPGGLPGNSPVSGNVWPAQCCMVVTLETALPRGRASKGRFYVPALSSLVDVTTGQIPDPTTGLLNPAKTLLNAINTTVDVGKVAVMSKLGVSGTSNYVTQLSVGRVPDTQRRRRRSLNENRVRVVL